MVRTRAVVETDTGVVARRLGVAVQEVRAGERRDERVGRAGATSSAGRPRLAKLAVDDHPDVAGERRGVLEVVRDEQRRDVEPGEQLLQLGADVDLRVRVERGEGLVEEQDLRVAGQRAGERDALPLAAGEAARAGALEVP